MPSRPAIIGAALFASFPVSALAAEWNASAAYVIESGEAGEASRTVLVPLSISTSLAGFDLEFDVATVSENSLGRNPTARRRLRDDQAIATMPRYAGVTDTSMTVKRSFPLGDKLALDVLMRGTLPTGDVTSGWGEGRREFMADIGGRIVLGKFSLWAGGARRYRSHAQEFVSSRDINELYVGAHWELGEDRIFRLDYLRAQSEYRGYRREQRISAEWSKPVSTHQHLKLFAIYRDDLWGRDINVGASVSWATRLF